MNLPEDIIRDEPCYAELGVYGHNSEEDRRKPATLEAAVMKESAEQTTARQDAINKIITVLGTADDYFCCGVTPYDGFYVRAPELASKLIHDVPSATLKRIRNWQGWAVRRMRKFGFRCPASGPIPIRDEETDKLVSRMTEFWSLPKKELRNVDFYTTTFVACRNELRKRLSVKTSPLSYIKNGRTHVASQIVGVALNEYPELVQKMALRVLDRMTNDCRNLAVPENTMVVYEERQKQDG